MSDEFLLHGVEMRPSLPDVEMIAERERLSNGWTTARELAWLEMMRATRRKQERQEMGDE